MRELIILLLFVLVVRESASQNYGTIGMPGGTLTGGELDSIKVTILQHQESDNTSATIITKFDQWDARTINTEVIDQIGVTIVGDTAFTLPSGTYLIDYSTSFFADLNNFYHIQTRIYNQTAASEVGRGESWTQANTAALSANLSGHGFVSLGSAATLTIQHWLGPSANINSAREGYRTSGINAGTEIFATVTITKLN